ncbi:MAG: ribosome biogenesis GTPase Der [Bacillota bacterium]|nr:ribosome biogenesis GTPase Der [Bacillota bacterium]
MPIVALVGRPNVGKSTLFNRILRRRHAIVEGRPGVTRDRIAGEAEWRGRRFTLLDTGGLEAAAEPESMAAAVHRMALAAVEEADLLVFLVDGRQGVTPDDEEAAALLRRSGKPLLLAVNKLDPGQPDELAFDFFRLGLGEPLALSAEHGRGVGHLLDRVLEELGRAGRPAEPVEREAPADAGEGEGEVPAGRGAAPSPERPVRVAVVGRPNVGKSSLINRILRSPRLLVTPVAGTTRDAVDVPWQAGDRSFVFVDTAGLRRRARVHEPVEFYSTVRTLRALERADVACLVLDATQGVTEQDVKIGDLIEERGRACVVAVNKWDLIEKETGTSEAFVRQVRERLHFLAFAPVVTLSARTGQRLERLPHLFARAADHHRVRLATSLLNRVVSDAVALHHPPAHRGKPTRIYYVTQTGSEPPVLTGFTNAPGGIDRAYERYLESRLREVVDLEGTPVRWRWRERPRRAERAAPPGRRLVPRRSGGPAPEG